MNGYVKRLTAFVKALEYHGHGTAIVSCQYGHEAHWPGPTNEYVPLHASDLRDVLNELATVNECAEQAERAEAIEKARCASAEKLMAAEHKRAETAERKAAGLQAAIDATDPVRQLAARLAARLAEQKDADAEALLVENCELRTEAEQLTADRDQWREKACQLRDVIDAERGELEQLRARVAELEAERDADVQAVLRAVAGFDVLRIQLPAPVAWRVAALRGQFAGRIAALDAARGPEGGET